MPVREKKTLTLPTMTRQETNIEDLHLCVKPPLASAACVFRDMQTGHFLRLASAISTNKLVKIHQLHPAAVDIDSLLPPLFPKFLRP